MSKLEPENQIDISKKNLEKILVEYEITDFSYEIIQNGIANTSVFIKTPDAKFVLRIIRQSYKTDQEVLLELKFQDYLRSFQIPIPKIYKNRKGEELSHIEVNDKTWQIILMEFAEGKPEEEYSDNIISEFAQIQAKMHKLGIDFAKTQPQHLKILKRLRDTIAGDVLKLAKGDSRLLGFLERATKLDLELNQKLPYGYNHLDFDFGENVLLSESKITAILDFDDLSYSPCVVCLGYTLWHILFTNNDWKKVNLYIKEYNKIRKLSELEYQTLPQVMSFRNYVLGIIELSLWNNTENAKKCVDLEKSIFEHKFI